VPFTRADLVGVCGRHPPVGRLHRGCLPRSLTFETVPSLLACLVCARVSSLGKDCIYHPCTLEVCCYGLLAAS
jgi:hypothetical protein